MNARQRSWSASFLWPLLAACGLAGLPSCTVGPNYVAPRPKMPDSWEVALIRGLAQGQADLQTWWTVLRDPVLDSLSSGRASPTST